MSNKLRIVEKFSHDCWQITRMSNLKKGDVFRFQDNPYEEWICISDGKSHPGPETATVALLEALSCGIPVVCTQAVPVEIVPPIVAIQCESNSVEALTIAMNQMIEKQKTFDPIEISKFAQSVCSKQVVASKIIQVYQSILTKNDSISTK